MRKTLFVLLAAILLAACSEGLAILGPSTAPNTPVQVATVPAVVPLDAPPRVETSTPRGIAPAIATSTGVTSSTPRRQATKTPMPQATATYTEGRVVKIVDGDTIDVSINDKTYAVRYIGINAPEDTTLRQPYGPEATAKNRELVAGKTVRLEKDLSETDRYGRLLRYVYVGDVMVNAELVRQGFAQATAYPPDVKYQALFNRLEQEARAANRGLWGMPAASPSAPQQSAPVPAATQATASGYTCDRCIKGNISGNGEKIYHLPGCHDYDKTVITESQGERWFSSEAEARAAGWQRAMNCP